MSHFSVSHFSVPLGCQPVCHATCCTSSTAQNEMTGASTGIEKAVDRGIESSWRAKIHAGAEGVAFWVVPVVNIVSTPHSTSIATLCRDSGRMVVGRWLVHSTR